MIRRIAHATDIHWHERPSLNRLSPKRMLGGANLYLRGRVNHFDRRVQSSLVQAMIDARPDVALFTGDLTAEALPTEFALAHTALAPLFAAVPSFVQNGNHDVYTFGAARARRIENRFGPWMHLRPSGLGVMTRPGVHVVGLDPTRPHALASGRVPRAQLDALHDALAEAPPDAFVVLAQHYPILDRTGAVYDGLGHGLLNARELIEVLRTAPRKPDLIVHGHIHHGFTVPLDLGDVSVPICNPGSGGYAHMPSRSRAACFNVYVVDGPKLIAVERYRHGPNGFEPEAGGAYATGR